MKEMFRDVLTAIEADLDEELSREHCQRARTPETEANFAPTNEAIYVGREYNRDCMLKRDRYMVDRASILLAVYNGAYRNGTGMAVRYAQRLDCEIIIIDPVIRTLSKLHPID